MPRPLLGAYLLLEPVRSDPAVRLASQECIHRMGMLPWRLGQKQAEERAEQHNSDCAAAMQLVLSQHGCCVGAELADFHPALPLRVCHERYPAVIASACYPADTHGPPQHFGGQSDTPTRHQAYLLTKRTTAGTLH